MAVEMDTSADTVTRGIGKETEPVALAGGETAVAPPHAATLGELGE